MKKLTLLLFLFSLGKAYAQQPNNYTTSRPANPGYNRVSNYNKAADDNDYTQIRIVDSTQEIRADVLPYKRDPKKRNDRYYYWYLGNLIHSTQGGLQRTVVERALCSLLQGQKFERRRRI